MENMQLYDFWRKVPQEAQKAFNNGRFSGTDINPMWRIKKLTEAFGPCGIGWYFKVLSERCEEHGDNDTIAIVDLELFVKVDGEWSQPIYGTGGNVIRRVDKYGKVSVSDEGYKMALTDALSVAAKHLGIGADIYFANDRTKYTASPLEEKPKAEPKEDPAPAPVKRPTSLSHLLVCEKCGMVLHNIDGKDGNIVTPEEQANTSSKYTKGRLYCPDCLKAWMKQKKEQEQVQA